MSQPKGWIRRQQKKFSRSWQEWQQNESARMFLATHRLDEVERICDQIAIIHEGKMHLSGNLDDIKGNWKMIEVIDELPVEEIQNGKNMRKHAGYKRRTFW